MTALGDTILAFLAQPVLAGFFDRATDGSATFGWVLGRVGVVLIIVNVLLVMAALLVWAERRVSAWMQDRLGPNRVGPEGLLQPLADLGKFVFKEDVIPKHTNRWLYVLAPAIAVVPAMITFAVIPFCGLFESGEGPGSWISWQAADLNIGVLYILSVTSLGVYGITLGGWSGNSKYSLLGGVRASAQMISYELSLGLAIVPVVLICGSLNLGDIVGYQGENGWIAFTQPLAFFVFLVSSYAETNRLPFDMPEAETELVAGYHTEYSSMKFALFFMSEYVNMVVGAALLTTLFLGGWTFFGLEKLGWWMGLLIFSAKTLFFLFVFIWVRWTIPRFRYDQLMRLGWAIFLPLTLVNVMLTAGAMALDLPWLTWVLPFLLVATALFAAWLGWRRDIGAVPPLPTSPPAGGPQEGGA